MVTILGAERVTCELKCQMCMTDMTMDDKSIVITRVPMFDSHALCMDCWSLMIAAAYAWIHDYGKDGSDGLNERLEQAWAIFDGAHGR